MNKVILKTALGTLAALIIAALAAFGLWIAISPQSMATLSERTGNYSFAVTCADMRYKRTGSVGDLARCAQDSILSNKDKLIVKYGEKLVLNEGFEAYCETADSGVADKDYAEYATGYKSYVCGNLAAAQFRTGDLDKAVQTAKCSNSFTKLIIEVIESGTKDDAKKVLAEYNGSDENLKRLLTNFIGE